MVSITGNRVYHEVVSFSCVNAITVHCQCQIYVEDDDDLQRFCGMLPLVVLHEFVTAEKTDLLHLD